MDTLVSLAHVAYVTASVIALAGVATILLRSADRTANRTTAMVAVGFMALWYGIVTVAGIRGAFVGSTTDLVAPIAFGLVPPLAIGLLALAFSAPLRRLLSGSEVEAAIIHIQTYRLVGVGFLVLMLAGQLPALFALPAGIGDLLIGLTAGGAATRVAAGERGPGVAWNLLGILDLVVAVGLGLTAAPGIAQVIVTNPTTAAVTFAPVVMVPAFLVPLSLWLHAASLWRLQARAVTVGKDARLIAA
jgi:hypothetical protein